MKRINLLCLFLLSAWLQISAGIPSFSRFDKITQTDGLSNNQVHCIFQEKTGWMWFGTSQGLNRYDGYHFTIFKNDVDGRGPLKGELVRCIFEDDANNIWVGTERGGLNRYDRDLETFTHFLFAKEAMDTIFSVNHIAQDSEGKIWIATNLGPAWLDENKKLQLLEIPEMKGLKSTVILRIFLDKRNNLWMGTHSGLFFYDHQAKSFKQIVLPDTRHPNDEIHSLCFDTDNILWVGTYSSGVYTVNTNSHLIKKLTPWPEFERSETVRAITEDHQGIIWFGTRGGLIAYDKVNQNYAIFLRDEDESLSLSLNSVLSLFVDSKGDLWVGTRGGISYRDKDKQAFTHLRASKNDTRFLNNAEVYCFYINGNDLLIGTESGGVNIYDVHSHRFRYITTADGLLSNCIKSIIRVGNEIWIGTFQGGISILDAQNYKVKHTYRNIPEDNSSLIDNRVWSIISDHKDRIWIGTNKGLQLFDPQSRSFKLVDTSLNGKACNWIFEDKDGDLWIGGDDELLIFNPDTKKSFYHKETTRGILLTKDNKYWVGTRGHGIALYDKQKGVQRYVSEADGLCNNTVQTIMREDSVHIWISTMNGLSRYNEKTGEFISFDVQDGLQDNQFNYSAAIITPDKRLVYGGLNGVNIFNPKEVRKNFFIPPVVFTGFKVFNQPLVIGSSMKKSINLSPKIELTYKQNVFSIDFAALSYANTKKNKYMYIMEGFDKEWISSGTINTATYTNLDPGKYVFKVKGSNSDGLWNEDVHSIEIVIQPPFWKTLWFIILLLVLVLLAFIYFGNFYLKKVRLKNELVFEKTKARKLHEIESMKLRFFTNISHEIRTPLTLILGPLNQVLETAKMDDESKGKLKLVRRNADQLLKLINQILDFRKLESGKYKISYTKADLLYFVNSIVESFQGMAAEKKIDLVFATELSHFFTWFDSDKMQKILNNLLSNALKFTGEKGRVEVSFDVVNNLATEGKGDSAHYFISVKDSGKGISEKNLKGIFERFFQGNNSAETTGSGIGLSITREFIKMMDGDIDVESKEGHGSTFCVRLPVLSDADISDEGAQQINVDDSSEESIQNGVGGENKKIILITEDNADVREYVASHFRGDCRVLEAENGKEAYELAVKYIPDIIISDLLMPVMNGSAFCKKIKKDERTSHIPFILLTAVTSKESEKEAFMAGADDYITKPFDIQILRMKVDNLISLRDTLKEKYKNDMLLQPSNVTLVSPDEKFLKKAVDTVEKYMSDPDLDIEKFASEVGVSRMQLYRKLEALTNMTVKEFIRDIRIKRAAQLLEQNKASVSEIVYQVGFRDLAYFRKCFREQYGTSPSEYAAKFK